MRGTLLQSVRVLGYFSMSIPHNLQVQQHFNHWFLVSSISFESSMMFHQYLLLVSSYIFVIEYSCVELIETI